jgi:hypothetical protein
MPAVPAESGKAWIWVATSRVLARGEGALMDSFSGEEGMDDAPRGEGIMLGDDTDRCSLSGVCSTCQHAE